MKRDLFDELSTAIPTQVIDLIGRGALFVVNHSGGKDSQAMYLLLRQHVPAAQMVIVHADLGAVEWAGAVDTSRRPRPANRCTFAGRVATCSR